MGRRLNHPEWGADQTELVVLKSADFGTYAEAHGGTLPYRVDRLRSAGFGLVWDDRRARLVGWRARLVGRLEALATPYLQTWWLRRDIARAPATVAFFESEGHALALARALGVRRRTVLVVMTCWLGEITPQLGRSRRALYRALYRHVDIVTVFTDNQIPILVDVLRIDPRRIHAIPFGIDCAEVQALNPSNGDYFLAVGRDSARDWDTLFAGVAGTGRRVIVLARPSRLPALAPPAEVEVLGYVDRARYLELLAGCAGVLIVTRAVSYPSGQTVLLEALALGKRCVVTETPAMKSFGADLPCRWVPVSDPAALHEAIGNLDTLAPPDVALDRLDTDAMWRAVAALINDALAGRG